MIFTLLPNQSILNCRYGMAIEFFEDILIACMDGLTGFPDAVKAVCRDLKEVYSAINAESGHEALEEFGKKWNDKYPMIQASLERNWNDLTEFFNYPKDIRRAILIYRF